MREDYYGFDNKKRKAIRGMEDYYGFNNKRMEELVEHLECYGLLHDKSIRDAFLAVDPADFVPERAKKMAYVDHALSIGEGQTISQPRVVAFMLELLQLKKGDKIMDVGAGSGWQTGLLAKIVGDKGEVNAVEVIPQLLQQAQNNLDKYDFENIKFFGQNERYGLPQLAPFNGIIAGASGEKIPQAWKDQLKIGGRIVAPVGNSVILITRESKDKFEEREYPGFIFVPLVNGD